MKRFYRDLIIAVRDLDPGINAVKVICRGTTHPRLNVVFNGDARSFVIPGTPTNAGASVKNQLRNIQKTFGMFKLRKEKTMSEVTESPVETRSWSSETDGSGVMPTARVAIYPNNRNHSNTGNRLRLLLNQALIESAGFTTGKRVFVKDLGTTGWEVRADSAGQAFFKPADGYQNYLGIDAGLIPARGHEPFGMSPAEAVLVEPGVVLVTSDPALRKPRTPRVPVDTITQKLKIRSRNLVVPASAPALRVQIRTALDEVRRIEAETGYRLVRRDDDTLLFYLEDRIE